MKRYLAVLLAIVILVLPCGISVNAENELPENSKNMITFIKDKNNDLLVDKNNYAYMRLGAKWYSDVGVNYCLQMSDMLIGTGTRPDKEKYMDVLINIIAVNDMDNATNINNQKKQDNLKNLKDYSMDTVKLVTDAVSLYSGLEGIKGELSTAEENLSKAIDGLSVLSSNTENWIDTLTKLETFTQDFSDYNSFLKYIEENSDGALKDASSSLRTVLKQSYLIKLEAYSNITSENCKNYTQFFFDDIFFDAAKKASEYQTDEVYSFFINSSENFFEKTNILKDSWNLGTDIGKLIGNITVGGENLINRTFEIEALYDISTILQTKVLNSTSDFSSHLNDSDADKYIDEYITYANLLIGCRIRGEYCTYTILAEDSGLLSLLSDKTDAKNWYDSQSSAIIRLKNKINNIKSSKETTSNITNEKIVSDIIQTYNGTTYYAQTTATGGGSRNFDLSNSKFVDYKVLPVSVNENERYIYNFIIYNDKVYYTISEQGSAVDSWTLKSCNLDGGDITVLLENVLSDFKIDNGILTIGISSFDSDFCYRLNLSTGKSVQEKSDNPEKVKTVGGCKLVDEPTEFDGGLYYKEYIDNSIEVKYYRKDIKSGIIEEIGSGFQPSR